MGTKSNIASGAAKAAGKGTKAWAITMTCVAGVSAATAVAVPVVMTVTQKQNVTKYTITFESNGGSEVKPQEVESDKTGVEPVVPTRNGFTFNGWYSDEALTQAFDWNTKITNNIKLYAKWTDAIVSRTCKVKFDLGGAEVIGGSINRNITKGTPFSQINCPSFIYPAGKKFVRWDCNDSFIINDEENETTIKAIYEDLKQGEVAQHKVNFVIDGSEHLEYGELHLDVDKGMTWPQVVANSKFPVITNPGFIENDFRMPPKDDAEEITYFDQNYVFGQNASYLTVNVNWEAKEDGAEYSRVVFLIDEEDIAKGDITSGYRTLEVKKGTKWTDIAKPIVDGFNVGTKVYPFDGWDYPYEEITDNVVTYAKFGALTDNFDHKIILNAGEIGKFSPEGEKTHTIHKESASEQVKFSDFNDFISTITLEIKDEYKDKYKFWGWGVNANDVIPVGTTRLSAIYYNIEKCYLIFASGDDVSITGSQAFYINKNTTWAQFKSNYTVPTASKVGGYTQTGWKFSSGVVITDETQITTDTVLYPVFEKTDVYYDVNLSVETQYGQLSTTKIQIAENSTWANVKEKIDLTMNSKYILLNWINSATQVVMADTDVIKSNLNVKANCDLLLNHCVKATVTEGSTLSPTIVNSANIYYSTDEGNNWTKLTHGNDVTFNTGTVYFKGDNKDISLGTYTNCCNLKFKNGKVALSGNIMTLINSSELTNKCLKSYQFARLFQSSPGLISVNKNFLPATTLSNYCYHLLFQDCANLVSAPIELKANTVNTGAYYSMFSACPKLEDAPLIYASILQEDSCRSMFQNCSNLKYISIFAPTTVGTRSCNSMFMNCESLLVAPYLPATTLSSCCYQNMFTNCTNLLYSPDLMAENAVQYCYDEMFKGCSSLASAPYINLKNLKSNCCKSMFSVCTLLTDVQSNFVFDNVNSIDFNASMDYMFYGCKELINLPEITLNTTENLTTNGLSYAFSNAGNSSVVIERVTIGSPIPEGGYKIIDWPTNYSTQNYTFKIDDVARTYTNLEAGWTYYYKI